MKKNLLICPSCLSNGTKQVLGELDEQGNLLVMRFKGQGRHAVTKVISPQMYILCGNCNEEVFYRKNEKNG